MKQNTYSIVGGGIAGLTTAIALQNLGLTVKLYEAAPEIKAVGAGLGLGTNALKALRLLGLEAEIIQIGQPMRSISILSETGRVITRSQFATADGRTNVAVHRAELHALLLSKLIPGTLETAKRLRKIDQNEGEVGLHFEDGSYRSSQFLIVADGIHSKVSQQLIPHSKPRFARQISWRGVTSKMDTTSLEASETWGEKGRFGIVPLTDGRVYWFAVVNGNESDPRYAAYDKNDLLSHFSSYHSLINQIINRTPTDKFIKSDIQDLKPINHYAYKRIVLIGDAAHATTPNLAQGACQAIEDAIILANCIKKHKDTTEAFKIFEQRRLKRTHWIIKTSRKLGIVAQYENSVLIGLRNLLFSSLPESLSKRQFQKLEEVDLG